MKCSTTIESINTRLRDILDRRGDQWGVKVERVESKEVDPVGTVKQAMTEQTAAERERRTQFFVPMEKNALLS